MRRERDDGAIAIIVAVLALVLFGFGALVVDLGAARDQRRQAQAAADATSLAGAGFLLRSGTDAALVTQIKAYATTAYGVDAAEWAACRDAAALPHRPDSATGDTCISYDSSLKTFRVRIPTRVEPTFFAGALHLTNASVTAAAVATWKLTDTGDCVICVLSDYRSNGQADLDANGYSMAIGGDVRQTGHSAIKNAGTISVTPGEEGDVQALPSGTPVVVVPSVPDPLASLVLPAAGQLINTTTPSGFCAPGAYFNVSTCTSFTRNGVYIVTNQTTFKGNDTTPPNIQATFYFTCDKKISGIWKTVDCRDSHTDEASLKANGNGKVVFSGSDAAGAYPGLGIIFDRDLAADLTVGGNGALIIFNAGIYAKSAQVTIDGGGNSGGLDFNGPVIVGSVTLNGGGTQGTVFKACTNAANQCGTPFHIPGTPTPPHLIE